MGNIHLEIQKKFKGGGILKLKNPFKREQIQETYEDYYNEDLDIIEYVDDENDEYYDENDNFNRDKYFDEYEDEYDTYDFDLDDEADVKRLFEKRHKDQKQSKLEEEQKIAEYFEQGLTLEEIEAIEYRQAKREKLQAEAQKEAQDRIDFIQSFARPQTIFAFIGFYVGSLAYLYILTSQFGFSALISIFGGYLLTKSFVFRAHQVNRHENDLQKLENLANDIAFEAQSGKNVYNTLASIIEKDQYDGRVEQDIRYTFAVLQQETVLDLSVFEVYQFTPFNLFLRNVSIWYREGIPINDLFEKALNNISFELIKRDELRKSHNVKLKTEMMTVGITLMIPLFVKYASGELYALVMGQPIPITILMSVYYMGQVLIVTKMKERSLEVNIR